MHCSSIPSPSNWKQCPIPNRSNFRRNKSIALSFRNAETLCPCSLRTTHNRTEEDNLRRNLFEESLLFHRFDAPIDTLGVKNQNREPEHGENLESRSTTAECEEVVSTNMRWADLKAALGQRINVEGIVSSASVLFKDQQLVLPHVTVPDIRYIDWAELKSKGFEGVVFDKDNTLTAPYSLTLWPPLASSMKRCKAVFGDDIVVFSNSAGLSEYDHDGSKATALEGAIGIRVLRHRVKKPAGTAEEIEEHFGCESSQLIMVGDRPFTDIVYGNRNGFLTILTEALTPAEEPFIVRQVRKLEIALLNHWFRSGLKPTSHQLLPDATVCVKDTPPM